MHKDCALILGGYINGYSIIRELHACGVKNIWLFDYGTSLARKSNKITGCTKIEKNAASLKNEILQLRDAFDYLVIYPTDDLQLEMLHEIYSEIMDFCFLPFNPDNLLQTLDKSIQYEFCDSLGIPYPKTEQISRVAHLNQVANLQYPVVIKPNTRVDLISGVFRSLFLECPSDLENQKGIIKKYLKQGFTFLASEYVPGDDTNLYGYTGYRAENGLILSDWIGKKLTQYPDLFGVFSSASNDAPEIVREQSRILMDGMDLRGISGIEFKYDLRDQSYKLMEINLRSSMWNRIGNLSGVNVQFTQWLDATGQIIKEQMQERNTRIHFIYMKHEVINLFSRLGYIKHFVNNVFGGDKRGFAVFDLQDLKPFLYDLSRLPRTMVAIWLRILRKRLSIK